MARMRLVRSALLGGAKWLLNRQVSKAEARVLRPGRLDEVAEWIDLIEEVLRFVEQRLLRVKANAQRQRDRETFGHTIHD